MAGHNFDAENNDGSNTGNETSIINFYELEKSLLSLNIPVDENAIPAHADLLTMYCFCAYKYMCKHRETAPEFEALIKVLKNNSAQLMSPIHRNDFAYQLIQSAQTHQNNELLQSIYQHGNESVKLDLEILLPELFPISEPSQTPSPEQFTALVKTSIDYNLTRPEQGILIAECDLLLKLPYIINEHGHVMAQHHQGADAIDYFLIEVICLIVNGVQLSNEIIIIVRELITALKNPHQLYSRLECEVNLLKDLYHADKKLFIIVESMINTKANEQLKHIASLRNTLDLLTQWQNNAIQLHAETEDALTQSSASQQFLNNLRHGNLEVLAGNPKDGK